MCGVGAEIAAAMMEPAFDELDAPVGRIHTDPTAHPFSPAHEGAVIITTERIVNGAKAVLAGKPIIPRRLHGVKSKAGSKPAAHAAPAAATPPPRHRPRRPRRPAATTANRPGRPPRAAWP